MRVDRITLLAIGEGVKRTQGSGLPPLLSRSLNVAITSKKGYSGATGTSCVTQLCLWNEGILVLMY